MTRDFEGDREERGERRKERRERYSSRKLGDIDWGHSSGGRRQALGLTQAQAQNEASADWGLGDYWGLGRIHIIWDCSTS